MPSINAQAFSDFKALIDEDGEPVTLIAPDDAETDLIGQVVRRDAIKDPNTNIQVAAPLLAVSVSLSGLAVIPVQNEWAVRTADSTGAILTSQVAEVRVDRTIGFVTLVLEEYDG